MTPPTSHASHEPRTLRPRIGISAYPRLVEIVPVATTLHTANRFYVDAVSRAGGLPLVVPVLDAAAARDAVAALDGLVLTGGGDVDPGHYGEAPADETNNVNPARDAWEMALALAALDEDLPMLATCRGAQVLNVALGGSLVQHVPTATGARHGWADRHNELVHDIRLEPSSALARFLGRAEVGANSLHHQAVAACGRGVRAVGWAPDGTIEAFEVADHPEVVAVQWHPELLEDDDDHQSLFSWLVARATARGAQMRPSPAGGVR